MALEDLSTRVEQILIERAMQPQFQEAIEAIAQAFEARTVTLHAANNNTRLLLLVAEVGLPEKLKQVTSTIPFGKGMAGLCVERLEPVMVCNLQTDSSGQAKPGAKETGVAGAIVFPVFGIDGRIAGTLGIGKAEEHVYTEGEKQVIQDCAEVLGRKMPPA